MTDEETMREFVRALFTDPDAVPVPHLDSDADGAEHDPQRGNVVPSEGKHMPAPPRDIMRDFARDLFGYTD